MRHYEILANFCIPYFPDIENCPSNTMFNFPKDKIIQANKLFTNNFTETIKGMDEYCDLLYDIFEYTKNNLTTKKIAEYVINIIKKGS